MTRRGVALILVLLVLVMATTAIAGAAGLVMATRRHTHVTDHARVADALRAGAEGFIDCFLRMDSPRVVLGPESSCPALRVLDDTLEIKNERYRVTVTAFDQCGMVPWGQARRGSPLRAALPHEIASAWDTRADPSGPPGLDRLALSAHGGSAYPPAEPGTRRGAAGAGGLPIGAYLATHNPEPLAVPAAAVTTTGGLINVNTTPRALLGAALRASGSSGLDEILDARARGQLAHAPQTSPGRLGVATPVRLVSQSDCWAFRIDVESRSIQRSWWCVYRATGSQWRCVQRVAIDE